MSIVIQIAIESQSSKAEQKIMIQKRWVHSQVSEEAVRDLQQALKIHPIFCKLLVQRGIYTFDQAKLFFRPELTHLHDPFLMKDMDKAVYRLTQAIQNQEKILLYGDYDVDGTTSVALMYSFLSGFYKNIDYYIPDRYKEGYGVSEAGVAYAAQHGFSLIIAMDCGIKAIDKVALAKQHNIDFIIADHHLPEAKIPDAIAVLDPKRTDCNYPYKELSGCGIAFKLAQAYTQYHEMDFSLVEDLLDLLVVSIGCDIVPITGENRVLAFYGLKKLNQSPRLGLKALIYVAKKSYPLTISDVVFGVGPLINAAGRLADAKQAVKVLLATHKQVAKDSAEALNYKNIQRRTFERNIAKEASLQFEALPNHEQLKTVVLHDKDWHKGVIGIVASRMVERFHRPTIILTSSGEKIVGSARSVRGFDIHEAIHSCEHLLVNFGGHKYAAGVTMTPEVVSNFKQQFEQVVTNSILPEHLVPEVRIDAVLDFKNITPKFWNILRQFAPFGPKNMRPVFQSVQVKDSGTSRLLKEKHIKFKLKQEDTPTLEAIGFSMAHHFQMVKSKAPFNICYTITENNWKGRKNLQLNIKDLRF